MLHTQNYILYLEKSVPPKKRRHADKAKPARTGKGKTAETAALLVEMLGEAGIDALLGMVTGGASAATKLGSKGGKVLKYADDIGDLAKRKYSGAYEKIDDVLFSNKTDNNSEVKRYFEDFFENQKEITASQHNEVLQFRNSRNKIDIQNGVSYFPKNEEISEYVKKVKPRKCEGTNSYYFDVGMHGNQMNVAFSSAENAATASPEALAITIAQNKNYVKRQPVRLLSCNTGVQLDGKECFAQKLANVLNAPVLAPNNYLYIDVNGGTSVGLLNEGKMILFQPHYGLSGSDNIANLDKETWRTLLRGIIK